jgi:cell wall-associated NlpC family hydrolase
VSRKVVRKPKRTAHKRTVPKRAVSRPSVETVPAPPAGAAALVVAYALAQVGKPYRFASSGPGAFDCSGLAMAAYARVGVALPHQTGGIAGRGRSVGRAELIPGDLVFTDSGHVAIYIGGGEIVHATTVRGGVRRTPIYRFAFARRVIG